MITHWCHPDYISTPYRCHCLVIDVSRLLIAHWLPIDCKSLKSYTPGNQTVCKESSVHECKNVRNSLTYTLASKQDIMLKFTGFAHFQVLFLVLSMLVLSKSISKLREIMDSGRNRSRTFGCSTVYGAIFIANLWPLDRWTQITQSIQSEPQMFSFFPFQAWQRYVTALPLGMTYELMIWSEFLPFQSTRYPDINKF